MSEFREALQRLVEAMDRSDSTLGMVRLLDALDEAKALLARPEPEQPAPNENMRAKFDRWYKSPRGEAQFTLGMHYLGWAYICYAEGYKQAAVDREPAAAEKAREPMHEGFPVDTIVRDIFTDKVGTIVSYHCRFEVEWADGSNSMDVHSRQLDHCGPQPSPPAATGETKP